MRRVKLEYDLPNGDGDFIQKVSVQGKSLLLIRESNNLYLVQSRCPHAGANLGHGWCEAGHIICPYHRHQFDLKTGRGAAGQNNYINTYPLEITSKGLFVVLPSWWEFWK